ncbi:uncharacterized protein LOC128515359 [Clarias gariepinus]|uniref:uncharacterized protein LOC128515359 n=1 Tax=Clarias gariepinus TaxID=13013 RepID=UPI00234D256E|nr:uncharacterized protein LOC128515359 [Clarias gariepinus]
MITLFVALYSLLCLCTTVKTSNVKELHVKTVKHGEFVTMECNISRDRHHNNVFWYKQSFGELPQFLVRPFSNNLGYTFFEGFNDNRFSVTVNDQKFDLNINETREDDGGEYFCGYVVGSTVKFTSGTRLQFEGEEMKPCPTPGTLNKNTHSVTHQGSNSRDGEGEEIKPCFTPGTHDITSPAIDGGNGDMNLIIALIATNIISVIVIVALIGVLFKQRGKGSSSNNHQTPTNQADDEDVLIYAAVNSSRTSRDTSDQDVYTQVIYLYNR